MGRLSARSNPTGLVELDKSRVSISVLDIGGFRSFVVEKIDLTGLKIPDGVVGVVIAASGNSSARHDLGDVKLLARVPRQVDDLDVSHPLRFRLLLLAPDNPKLVASAENLRPRSEQQAESLLPMEAADLGDRVWKLNIADDGPTLVFNSRVFPSAAGAENYLPFVALVLPEALRQVMYTIARQPEYLADSSTSWFAWKDWLSSMGLGEPPEDEAAQPEWCETAVDRFCNRFQFASKLGGALLQEAGND